MARQLQINEGGTQIQWSIFPGMRSLADELSEMHDWLAQFEAQSNDTESPGTERFIESVRWKILTDEPGNDGH